MSFIEAFRWFAKTGVLEVGIPFVLAFALVYGILDKTRVLGQEAGQPKRKLNAIVAFCIALFVVSSAQIAGALRTFAVWSAVGLIAVLLAVALFSMAAGKEFEAGFKRTKSVLAMLAGIGLVLLALGALGVWQLLSWKAVYYTFAILLAAAAFVGIVYFVVYEKPRPKEERAREEEVITPPAAGEAKPI